MTPQGIRVNCIHSGLIERPMTEWVMKDPEILPIVLAQISMGRAGQPKEIGAVAALASDEASYLTGQSVFVDGGWQGKWISSASSFQRRSCQCTIGRPATGARKEGMRLPFSDPM